jgi:hypothetical protein
LEERLIWARENHVTPPDYALAAARAQGIEWAAYWPQQPKVSTACYEVNRVPGVLLIEALKCHGAGDNWQGLSTSYPPPPIFTFPFSNDAVEWVALPTAAVSSISFPPDVPPPRLFVAFHSPLSGLI